MDSETIALIATLVGVALGILGLLAAWYWRHKGSSPTPATHVHGPAAVGRDQQGPIVIIHEGGYANINTNTTVYAGKTQLPEGSAVADELQEGIRCQQGERHPQAVRAFERAFAAAADERDRATLHILIGNSYMKLGRLIEAEAHFLEARDDISSHATSPTAEENGT